MLYGVLMRYLIAVLVSAIIVGCTSFKYTRPSSVPPTENVVTLDAPFNDAWTTLVDYAGASFFGIDGFEKESGLMTLTFGAGEPERFIDCGYYEASGYGAARGPYVEILGKNTETDLTGRMNLVLREVGETQSKLTVNARYVYQIAYVEDGRYARADWVFESGTSASKSLGDWPEPIKCQPTGAAERAILDGVQERLANR